MKINAVNFQICLDIKKIMSIFALEFKKLLTYGIKR
jgi:hypothetical protein